MKPKTENIILGGVLALTAGVFIYKQVQKGKSNMTEEIPVTVPVIAPTAPAVSLNGNLLLKSGSKGNEVKQLQKILGVSQDGIFGAKTEAALVKLKGVKQITLNGFSTAVTVNQTALIVGQSIMAGTGGCTLFESFLAADNKHYTTTTVYKKLSFGEKIGKIVAMTASKNMYLCDYVGILSTTKVWVNASEVKKI